MREPRKVSTTFATSNKQLTESEQVYGYGKTTSVGSESTTPQARPGAWKSTTNENSFSVTIIELSTVVTAP